MRDRNKIPAKERGGCLLEELSDLRVLSVLVVQKKFVQKAFPLTQTLSPSPLLALGGRGLKGIKPSPSRHSHGWLLLLHIRLRQRRGR